MKPIDFFSNPEYALVILTSSELRFYIGDNIQLELIEAREVGGEETPQRLFRGQKNVIAHRPLMAMKRFGMHLLQMPRLANLPVVVAGDESLVSVFMRSFQHSFGVVTHHHADICNMTCPQLLKEADVFKSKVRDIYVAHFHDRLKSQIRSGRVISDILDIAKAAENGDVARLLLVKAPRPQTPETELAAAVIREGGKVQLIPSQLFPEGIVILGVLRGEVHAHSSLFAMDA